MKVWGFIGLGNQGAPIAEKMIQSGAKVHLWARRKESLSPFEHTCAEFSKDIVSLGKAVDHCGICVVDDQGVQNIVEQLIPVMKPGSSIAIHSTVSPDLCRRLEREALVRSIYLVDAPVSGGGSAAANGTLAVMVGGELQALDKVRPILKCFAGSISEIGPVGSAQLAKLINNNLMAANLALADNAIQLANILGINKRAFCELVEVSSGYSFAFKIRARMTTAKDFTHGATLLQKDVNLLANELTAQGKSHFLKDVAESFLQDIFSEK